MDKDMKKIPEQAQESQSDFRHIVRIANTDLDGNRPVHNSLRNIKGIGFMFSNLIFTLSGIDKKKKVGNLTDEEIKKIDEIIKDPVKYGAPKWMLNRRNDFIDGTDKHLVTADLTFTNDNDIKTMKKIKCYKGIRHISGLPARGQKTRSNFRKNKGKVSLGVKKKAGAKAGRM